MKPSLLSEAGVDPTRSTTAEGGALNWTNSLAFDFLSSPEDDQQRHRQHQQDDEASAAAAAAASAAVNSFGNVSESGTRGGDGDGYMGASMPASSFVPVGGAGGGGSEAAAAEFARVSERGDGDDDDDDDTFECGEALNALFGDVAVSDHKDDDDRDMGEALVALFDDGAVSDTKDNHDFDMGEALVALFCDVHENGGSVRAGLRMDEDDDDEVEIRLPVRDEIDFGASLNLIFSVVEEEEEVVVGEGEQVVVLEGEVEDEALGVVGEGGVMLAAEEDLEELDDVKVEGEEGLEELDAVGLIEQGEVEEEDATAPNSSLPPFAAATSWFPHIYSPLARTTAASRAQGLLRWVPGAVAVVPAVTASGAGVASGDSTRANQELFAFAVKEAQGAKGSRGPNGEPKGPRGLGRGWRSFPGSIPYRKEGGSVEEWGVRQAWEAFRFV